MKNICLINNGLHLGIASVGEGYRRAFEHLGLRFNFLNLRTFPKTSLDQMNLTVQAHLTSFKYDLAIFIQPTYLYSQTMMVLLKLKDRMQFASIQTEDPYSISAMMPLSPLFNFKFTNERKVAEHLDRHGFKYLPVACDTFQPYKKAEHKEFDVTMQCSFYGRRLEYMNALKALACKKYIAGHIGYAVMNDISVDMSGLTGGIGMIPRHMEYGLYSNSKLVLNPHRSPKITGKHYFNGAEKECRYIMDNAISPNPRFFDAIYCGAVPLNNVRRAECFRIIKKHDPQYENGDPFTLPAVKDIHALTNYLAAWSMYVPVIMKLQKAFAKHESYLSRAEEMLKEIDSHP